MLLGFLLAETTRTVTQTGLGLGAAIAIVCSWDRNRSILWAVLAGLFSWFYVIYYAVTRSEAEMR